MSVPHMQCYVAGSPATEPSAAAFRVLHQPGNPVLLPTTWDFAFGRLLADAGFPAIGTTSLGIAAAIGCRDGDPAIREATVELAQGLVPLSVERGVVTDGPPAAMPFLRAVGGLVGLL